jgi:acetate kinase
MGTRSGDIDVAILLYLSKELGYTSNQIDHLLNKQSGLKGICNQNDMRIIHQMIEEGNQKAKLALDMFVYRIKKYIGAYYAVLGRVDALVFTGGIGENDEISRRLIVERLPFKVSILVIPTDEELEIARECKKFFYENILK